MNSGLALQDYLRKIQEMKVKELLEPATTVDPSLTISKVINLMTETDTYDVYCEYKDDILTTNARKILNVREILIPIKSLLQKIKPISINDTLEKAAIVMTHYRIRSVPVTDGKKLVGIIKAQKIIELFSKQNLNWIRANTILTPDPIIIGSNESLAKARKMMISKRIDHLPVVHNGKVAQVITSMHLLKALVPLQRIGSDQKGINPIRRLESEIGNSGSKRIPQCNTNDSLNTIIDAMSKNDTTCCLLTLWDNLHGIITYRDLLNLLQTRIPSEVPLYIVGMPVDLSNAEIVKTKFQKIIKNLIKVHPEVEEGRVSIKKIHSTISKQQNFEISIKIFTPYRTYNYSETGRDLSKVFDELGKRISRNLSKRSKKRWKTSIRKIDRKDIF